MTRTLPVLLAAVAVAAFGAAAPAAAAPAETPTCVVRVEDPDNPTCFGTFREALQFASGGVLRNGPKNGGDGLGSPEFQASVDAANARADQRVSAGLAAKTVLSIEFEDPGHGGTPLIYSGSSGNCSTSTGNVDYELPAIAAAWNNRISSFKAYAPA